MNGFETSERKLIPAVLIYVKRGDEYLMIHRNLNPGDHHLGKWNGLGGKMEPNESALEAAKRELSEEAGLNLPLDRFRAQGVVHFPNFKPKKNEDWVVYIFKAQLEKSQDIPMGFKCAEGSLEWIHQDRLLDLSLWPGDVLFLKPFLRNEAFVGTIYYKQNSNGEALVEKHWIQTF